MPPVALIDLDGTLCDCRTAIRRHLDELRGPTEPPEDEEKLALAPHTVARQQIIMSKPGFWLALEPIPAGLQLADLLVRLGFDTHVFTKGPSNHPKAWSEKFEWCRVHVPKLKVTISEDKSLVCADVLVEDWPPYIVQWRQRCPSGLIIIPAQPWNGDFAPADNAIRYDGANLDDIRSRLELLLSGLPLCK